MKIRIFLTVMFLMAFVAKNNLIAQCTDHNHSGNTSSSNHSANHEKHAAGTQTFKVLGNCDLCKARIEKSALSVKGVKTAIWNKETKMLVVDLKSGTDIEEVYQAVTKAGHDTEKYKVADKIYNNLPDCCKYRN